MWMLPALLSACSSAPPPPELSPLDLLAQQQVTHAYGPSGETPSASVVVYRKDDHHVWVTQGGAGTPFRHELVLRVRASSAEAPTWPAALLEQLAATEKQLGTPFGPGGRVGDISLSSVELPYRHMVFRADPVLVPIESITFLQVVPIPESDWEDVRIIPATMINDLMDARMEDDPLGLVD
jgi:hypothetical protein